MRRSGVGCEHGLGVSFAVCSLVFGHWFYKMYPLLVFL